MTSGGLPYGGPCAVPPAECCAELPHLAGDPVPAKKRRIDGGYGQAVPALFGLICHELRLLASDNAVLYLMGWIL
jgi:hypothetical protein